MPPQTIPVDAVTVSFKHQIGQVYSIQKYTFQLGLTKRNISKETLDLIHKLKTDGYNVCIIIRPSTQITIRDIAPPHVLLETIQKKSTVKKNRKKK